MSVALFGLLWLIVAAIIIWGQNATAAACALFIEQKEENPKTDLRPIVAGVRRRRRDLARAGFRLIIPLLIHEGLNVEEAKRRLLEQRRVPYLTCVGRKGGAAVTAAAVNALIELSMPS